MTSNQSPPTPAFGVGGKVAVGRLDRALLGQAVGEQAVLEGECGVVFAGETSGVLDADGRAGRQFFDEKLVVVVEGLWVLPPQQRGHAHGHASGLEGDDQVGVHAQKVQFCPAQRVLGQPRR